MSFCMKVYIASHCRWAALHLADVLDIAGFYVCSSWHGKPFNATETHTEAERRANAVQDRNEVLESDIVLLIAGPDKYSGGKFVEVGIAIAARKKIVIL